MINSDFFISQVTATLFRGRLSAAQKRGLQFILAEWDAHHAAKDDRWLAYALGTTHHETDAKMTPIHEYGSPARFSRLYDNRNDLGNGPHDGAPFHGRGYVQLTGRRNYTRMGQHFGIDLVSTDAARDRVLDPAVAVKILFYGMETGAFTGRGFAQYFSGTKANWTGARAIINGRDRAQLVAGYAMRYYAAISHTV